MKVNPPSLAAATTCLSANWFSAICLAAFLTTISASAAAPQTGARGLNPTEQWVVAEVTEGKKADLSKKFPEKKDRKLSAKFVQDLLTGNLTGVKLDRNGVRIVGAIIDERIDISNAQIPWEVWLKDCQFSNGAIFVRANFAGTVSFENSTFKSDANFNGMKVGQLAVFNKAVFEGTVDFGSADIAGHFEAIEAQFKDKVKGTSFNSMKVRGTAFFRKAVFEGWVSFLLADFARNFEAQGAQFINGWGVDFYGMKVGQIANFNDAVFENGVDFALADIGNFEAKKAQFKDAVLVMMNCGGKGDFTEAKFSGSAYLNNADFAALDLSRSGWPKDGNDGGVFHMQGMSYKYICAVPGNEPASHKALLKLADQSAYTADVYRNLEEFFLRQGYRSDADQAFIAGKRREREEYFRSGQWSRWLGSWMLNLLVGYGRRPWQAGIPCAVLVALGCVLFSPKKMEPQKPEDTQRVYSRFWYSLGLFLPFVDLQADKVWKPKADQTFLRNYMRVHIILGWILVPLVLAALTGLIK
jgi:hypothetical protein